MLRSIKSSFSRFAAIFAITALGVGFLAGLMSTTPDMRRTIDHYYDSHDMMDIYLKSTYGFNDTISRRSGTPPGSRTLCRTM